MESGSNLPRDSECSFHGYSSTWTDTD